MERILLFTSLSVVTVLGVGIVLCAFRVLWQKTRRLAIWKMPRTTLVALGGIAAIATVTAQKGEPLVPPDPPVVIPAKLVYRSTLDSVEAITNPLVGENGTCANATFVEGKIGMALSVPAGRSVASVPFPNGLPAERGTLEFWAKLPGSKTTFVDGGDPMFLYVSRVSTAEHFAWIEFNANNGTGKGGLGASLGGVVLFTGSFIDSHAYSTILGDSVSDWHHYALVWNVEGISSLAGKPRFALLLDGKNVAQTNCDSNWNKDAFVANMADALQINLSHPGVGWGKSPYSIDELRVWDSEVTTFQLNFGDMGVRYVDANASEGGLGASWETAARTIDEVSRYMNGGVIYVKPGTYGAFTYKKPQGDALLEVIAADQTAETVIDSVGTGALANDSGEQATSLELRLEGFTVRNMNVASQGQRFDRCVVSNFAHGVACASSFNNCLVVANVAGTGEQLFEGCSFANCTVSGNVSAEGSFMTGCVAKNSIFWGNGTLDYADFGTTNCCVEGGTLGAFNIDTNPKFVNAATGNWCLAADSPCVDAGNDAFAPGKLDLVGNVRVQGEHVDIGAYEFRPPEVPARLVYHNTLDSVDAVVHPVLGADGTCGNATFVEGKVGSALYVPAFSNVATLQLPDGLPQARGCIEFWAKLQDGKTNYKDASDPVFCRIFRNADDASLFFFEFNANNGCGGGGLLASIGGLGIVPEVWSYSKSYSTYITRGNVSDWHHYAFVWNVDGIGSLAGMPRAAILVDGEIKGSTSGDNTWKKEDFLATLSDPLYIILSVPPGGNGKSPFAIDEFKIWDSDKTTFRSTVTHQDVSYVYDGTAHTLQPAVGAEGDEFFRYSLSEEGPYGEEMPTITDAGTLRIWYEVEAEGETTRASATVTVTKRPLMFTSASAQKPYDGIPLSATNVLVSGGVPQGEGFTFSVTGSQTIVGESVNAFTWSVLEGTNPDNYEVTTVCGILKVVMGPMDAGTEYEIVHGETDAVRITHLPYPNGGDVTLPSTLGGLPVAEIAAVALAGTGVTGVRVPSGVVVSGALFENLPNVTNVTLDAECVVAGALSCRGSAALQEVVVPASLAELAPHAFLGCWALERVVFAGEPPFGNNTDETAEVALLTASVRPATLLQMADMICYPVEFAPKWEKSLRNLGYGGKYGAFAGLWTGPDALIADSGNMTAVSSPMVVTNVIVSVVTNILVPAVPAEQPSAHYAAQAGRMTDTVLAGTAGWDVFGLPDGMTWDRETGTLGGLPTRSGTYDIVLLFGSGAETKMMRTTIDVAGYAVTTGYVGVAFAASGAPWDSLAAYKNLPAGLAWKNGLLSGTPTKAGAYSYMTTADESVTLVILELPDMVIGTYNGVLLDASGERYPLKVSTTAAGKLSATVTKGTKNYSLSAAKWSLAMTESVNGVPHRMFAATLTASGLSLSVKVDADAAWNADALTAVGTQGAMKDIVGSAQRNSYATDPVARQAVGELAGTYALAATSDGAGGWTLALPEEGGKGACTVVLKATGAAMLTGTLPDKTRVSASSTLHVDTAGAVSVRFYVKGKWITWQTAL